MNNTKQTDILVIGCGLAGAIAAISAADEGKNCYYYYEISVVEKR